MFTHEVEIDVHDALLVIVDFLRVSNGELVHDDAPNGVHCWRPDLRA